MVPPEPSRIEATVFEARPSVLEYVVNLPPLNLLTPALRVPAQIVPSWFR